MTYVLLDDKFHSNEKTLEVGNVGAGLYARALSYCGDHLTDGFVPLSWAREAGTPKLRRSLVEAGLWIEVQPGAEFHYVSGDESYDVEIRKPGYFIPDYLALNPTAASVKAKRDELSQKRAEAGRKGAMKRWQRHSKADGKSDSKTMASECQTDGPQPLPLGKEGVSKETPVDIEQERALKDVYDHWRHVRGKTDRRYDRISPQRRQKIKTRLQEFTADELKQALSNVALDTWAERSKHDDITTLFKSHETVDRWLEMTGKGASAGYDFSAYDRNVEEV